MKAGKSTLLNALVGERLAPTDAGECTRIVSWYRKGPSYQVPRTCQDGRDQPLAFKRSDGALDIELGALTERDVRWIDVRWPASALDQRHAHRHPGHRVAERRELATHPRVPRIRRASGGATPTP